MYNNGQSAANELTNQQIQVLITGKFGDGCLHPNSGVKRFPEYNFNYLYTTNSIHKEYVEYKKSLLGNLVNAKISSCINRGFKQREIYSISTVSSNKITEIASESLEKTLYRMDELGLALWFYDDGSLHKRCEFYNLNTQKFSEELNRELIAPFLKERFNIIAIPTIERKRDGREFWYLRIRKFEGAFIISSILDKYPVSCFDYKHISSETIQKWSKLQEKLKSTDSSIYTARQLSSMLKKLNYKI